MICYNCGIRLDTNEQKECRLCGVKFASFCPSCGFPCPPRAHFCQNCGVSTTGQALREESGLYVLSENRRNVAVIFADVSGFTALAEVMDPEEVREVINECFSRITGPVYELEGTIDKYIGDCVMVLFGARFPHSDDARRAVICAMQMRSLIREFSAEKLGGRERELGLSIGINYGLVVTGGVGNYFDKDYTVMGDIVNTAQRLQSRAVQDEILVSEAVYLETRDAIDYSRVRQLSVKNRKSTVRCYAAQAFNSEFRRSQGQHYVGRQDELNLLNVVYNRALNSCTQWVFITGEAGIGKTRLLKEFVSRVEDRLKVIWADCSPSFSSRPHYVVMQLLASAMNLSSRENALVRRNRLNSFIDYILNGSNEEDRKRTRDYMGLLLGLEREEAFSRLLDSMGHEDIRHELKRQLAGFFAAICRHQKILLVVEDLQWVDAGSLDLLAALVPALTEVNATVLISSRSRPEEAVFPYSDCFHQLELPGLKEEEVVRLAQQLLGCESLDTPLVSTITDTTRGNPLYVREYATHLQRTGACVLSHKHAFLQEKPDSDHDHGHAHVHAHVRQVPAGLQSLILSNFSGMDEESRRILQAASVVGKDFSLKLLSALLAREIEDEVLKPALQLNILSLKSSFTASHPADRVYTFNHDLEREVIYNHILKRSRRRLHKKIAELLDSRVGEDADVALEIRGHHFQEAGELQKAADCYYNAAVRLRDNYSLQEAYEYYRKYWDIIGSEGNASPDRRIVAACREMAYIRQVAGCYQEALEWLQQAVEYSSMEEEKLAVMLEKAEIFKEMALYDKSLELLDRLFASTPSRSAAYGRLLQLKCSILRITGSAGALDFALESEKILLETGDYPSLSNTIKQAGILYFSRGDTGNALQYLEKAYHYAEKAGSLDQMARLSGDIGILYHATGSIPQALVCFDRSIRISSQIAYSQGQVAASINLGVLYLDKGFLGKAEELFRKSLNIAEETGAQMYACISLTNLGDILYEKGDWEEAREHYDRSLVIARQINLRVEEAVNYISLGRLALKEGDPKKTQELLDQAYPILTEAGEAAYLADCCLYRGACLLMEGKVEEARQSADRALAEAGSCENDKRKAKALRLTARICALKGQVTEALEAAAQAVVLAEKLESDYEAAKCFFVQYWILREAGRRKEAGEYGRKALDSIKKVDECRWTRFLKTIGSQY